MASTSGLASGLKTSQSHLCQINSKDSLQESSIHSEKNTTRSSETRSTAKMHSDSGPNTIGPIYHVGYLGSTILTKGKTGLGCLQVPLRELYINFRQNASQVFQERRLIISLDGLSLLYNESGIEKVVHNELSSVNDVQLLKLTYEKRKDKKIHCAFLPFGEETLETRNYKNLYSALDKQHVVLVDQLAHPPVIALVMRRSTGIQALECHVLIARSVVEAKAIVTGIRSVCSKHDLDQNHATQVFQYQPFAADDAEEQHLDLITDLNTSSNALTSSSAIMRKKEMDRTVPFSETTICSKSETSITSQKSTTLFNRIKANLRERSSSRHRKKAEKEKDKGIPPRPVRSSSINSRKNAHDVKTSEKESHSKKKISKFPGKNFISPPIPSRDINQKLPIPKPHQVKSEDAHIIKQRKESGAEIPIRVVGKSQSKELQRSEPNLNSPDEPVDLKNNQSAQKSNEKRQSLGQRLISSLSSKSSFKSLASRSTSSLGAQSNSSLKFASFSKKKDIQDNQKHQQNPTIGDIDFRQSRTSIIDDNLLIDGHTIYPMIVHSKPPIAAKSLHSSSQILRSNCSPASMHTAHDNNFILCSRQSPLIDARRVSYFNASSPSLNRYPSPNKLSCSSHDLIRQQQRAQTYLSSPSLAASLAPPMRAHSVVSVNRADSQLNYSDAAFLDVSKRSFINDYKNPRIGVARQRDSKVSPTVNKPLTPEYQGRLLSNHLVWNKHSKSAESLDNKKLFQESYANMFQRQQQPSSSYHTKCESGSLIARAISPGIHLRNSPQPVQNINDNQFRSQSSFFSNERRTDNVRQHSRLSDYNDYIGGLQKSEQTSRSKAHLANQINSLINTNRNFHEQQASYSYTPSMSPKLRSYSPILAEVLHPSDRQMKYRDPHGYNSNQTKLSSFASSNSHNNSKANNEYSRLGNGSNLESASKLSSQTFFTTSIHEENSLNEKNFAEFLAENSEHHHNSSQQRHNKVVGGIKVFPTISHEQKQAALMRKNKIESHGENNEYNLIDYVREKTSGKEEYFKQIDQEFRSTSDYNMNKLAHHYTTTLTVDQELDQNLDNEVIDLTRAQTKDSNLNIEIPICLMNTTDQKTESKFVTYNKPRIVSTTFITPINDKAYSYGNSSSNVTRTSYHGQQDSDSESVHMTVTKPRYIYYYDDESFGGY